jgi:tight adherence protein B
MRDPTYLLVLAGAVVATFVLVIGLGRWLVLRYIMWRRARRYLDVAAPGQTPGASDEIRTARTLDERLAWLLTTHSTTVLLVLLAAVLLVAGGVVGSWIAGILLAMTVLAVAAYREYGAAARHRAELERQLVAALRLMASALQGGYSVPLALERVASGGPPLIAAEFDQVNRAIELGRSLHVALDEMAQRNRSDTFEYFATIVAVQYRVGGDLPSLLITLANTIEERLQLKADMATLTTQARFSGWVLAALPVGVVGVILLVRPTYFEPLVFTPTGRILLLFSTLLLTIGLLAVRTISRVEA